MRYVTSVSELQSPDLIFLPGSKNTMGDLKWMRQNGLEAVVKKWSEKIPICGICGGYQMLGMRISDPYEVEEGGELNGMGLLPLYTVIEKEKTRCQTNGNLNQQKGVFQCISKLPYQGYEIHMGKTFWEDGSLCNAVMVSDEKAQVYGSYVHGLFDQGEMAVRIVEALAEKKGITMEHMEFSDYQAFKAMQYDKLADTLRAYLDMDAIYGMLREARLEE